MAFLLPSSSVRYGDFSWQSQLHQRTKQRVVAAATVGGPPKKLFTATTLSAKAGLNVTRNEANIKAKASRRRGIPARSKSSDALEEASSGEISARRGGRRSSGGSKAIPRRAKSTTDALFSGAKDREGGPDIGTTIIVNNDNSADQSETASKSNEHNDVSTTSSASDGNKSKKKDKTSRAEAIIKRAATFRRMSLDVAAKHEGDVERESSDTTKSSVRRTKSSDASLQAAVTARRGGRKPDGERPGLLDGSSGNSRRRLKPAAHSFKLSTSSKSLRSLVES